MTSIASVDLNETEILPTKPGPNVIICIPAFNEEGTIGRIVSRSKEFCSHVVVCDDGSIDKTSLEATKSGAIVAAHIRNRGKGAALKTLLQEASEFDPDVIVTLDGDGQHDPSDVPLLVAPVMEGTADVVIGCRFNGRNRMPYYREIGNSLLSLMTNWSAGTRVRDTQSGFRAYSSNVIPSNSIIENGMGVDSEILINLARQGFRIKERNVAVTYGGGSFTPEPAGHIIRGQWRPSPAKHRILGGGFSIGWYVPWGAVG